MKYIIISMFLIGCSASNNIPSNVPIVSSNCQKPIIAEQKSVEGISTVELLKAITLNVGKETIRIGGEILNKSIIVGKCIYSNGIENCFRQ